jgi:uroporphyrin-III C-methyltransferase
MGVTGAGAIQSGLLQGLAADTPVAIVQSASLPKQQQALCTLAFLQQTIVLERIASPAVIVVGDVLKGALALAMPQPVFTNAFG